MTDQPVEAMGPEDPLEPQSPEPPDSEAEAEATWDQGQESLAADLQEGEPAAAPSPEGEPTDDSAVDSEVDDLALMKGSLADLTNDLQRLQAEYANYRKRVDRDRQLVAENAAYRALTPVVEVLDTIDRAKDSARSLGGELDEGFKAVADQLERAVGSSGLVRFGEPGDAFDPNLHEALSHLGADPDVTVTTVKHVAKAGYRIGDRVVRAAQVLVVDPADG